MMLDIHSHIIPKVDDGSNSLEISLSMIKESVESGVTDIIATPHYMRGKYEKDVASIKEGFDLLVKATKEQNIPVNLYLGQEIYVSHFEKVFNKLQKGELLSLNDSKVILIEFSMVMKPEEFDDIIYNFELKGYKVIVAHVERYPWMSIEDIQYLKSEGALIQVNSGSLLGKSKSFREKIISRKAIKLGLVDFIASDMHSFRRTTLATAIKKFDKKNTLNNGEILGI